MKIPLLLVWCVAAGLLTGCDSQSNPLHKLFATPTPVPTPRPTPSRKGEWMFDKKRPNPLDQPAPKR